MGYQCATCTGKQQVQTLPEEWEESQPELTVSVLNVPSLCPRIGIAAYKAALKEGFVSGLLITGYSKSQGHTESQGARCAT